MAALITVTGAKIPLCKGHKYLLGRAKDCDIVVDDDGCSRKHAQITLAEVTESAFIEDLGSRNGTFLNGEPVGPRTVVPEGGRLRIGSSVFLVQLAEEIQTADFEETSAVGDLVTGARDLAGGELSEYGVAEILKTLMAGQRSVTVFVAMRDTDARVEVRDGEVVAAHFGAAEGFNALVRLGRAESGIFWMTENAEMPKRNVHEPSSHLIVELLRCLGTGPTAL